METKFVFIFLFSKKDENCNKKICKKKDQNVQKKDQNVQKYCNIFQS